ncbi:MAG: hypothetical protein AAF628_31165 [Planctomycetota bacterium]
MNTGFRSTGRLLALGFVSILALSSAAQPQTYLAQGDIASAGGGFVGILDPDGSSARQFPSASSISRVLWDPNRPNEFVCGGSSSSSSTGGFLIRQVFTSSSQMVTQALAPTGAFGAPVQLSWDSTGDRVIVVTNYDQVHSVDATTGQVTDLTTGVQPWGNDVSCGAMDPSTQDVFVGTFSGEIWRLASGGGPATLFATVPGSLQHLLLTDIAAPRYLHYLTSDRFGRLALDLAGNSTTYFGALGQPAVTNLRAMAVDPSGDFLLLQVSGDGNAYTLPRVEAVPLAGIAPSFLGSFVFSGSSGNYARDITIVGATNRPFRLTVDAVPILGASVTLDNPPEPLGRGWLLFSASTFLPVDSGPLFGIMPDSLTLAILGLPATPGGPLSFAAPAPTGWSIPQFGMAPFFGQTWDCVAVAFAPGGQYLGRTNVERVTWQ